MCQRTGIERGTPRPRATPGTDLSSESNMEEKVLALGSAQLLAKPWSVRLCVGPHSPIGIAQATLSCPFSARRPIAGNIRCCYDSLSSSTNLHWQINSDVKLFLGLATRSLHSRASIGPELDGVVGGNYQSLFWTIIPTLHALMFQFT